MKSSIRLFVLVVAVISVSISAFSRGPSTAEERQKAVQMVRSLEQDPAQESGKEKRAWLVQWLSEVPDITVTVCIGPLEPLLGEKDKTLYGPEIFFQVMLSSAAFIIENPDKADDKVDVYQAGLEGALKVYSAYLAKDPKVQRKFIDDLLEKQKDGKLEAVAKKAVKECK